MNLFEITFRLCFALLYSIKNYDKNLETPSKKPKNNCSIAECLVYLRLKRLLECRPLLLHILKPTFQKVWLLQLLLSPGASFGGLITIGRLSPIEIVSTLSPFSIGSLFTAAYLPFESGNNTILSPSCSIRIKPIL